MFFRFLFSVLLAVAPVAAAQQIAPREPNTLRIMSYNVCNGRGLDGQLDYDRMADVVRSAAPDIVAIQEVDSATTRSQGRYVLKELADRCLMFPYFAPAIDFDGGKYGIGILSREKPLRLKQLPLPGREEARALLVAEFEQYLVACTHLSLTADDRLASVALIRQEAEACGKPFFLVGDLNATPDERLHAALRETFTVLNNPVQNTFPADRPTECLDYIYATQTTRLAVIRRQVVNEAVASDHRPVVVDVRIATPTDRLFRSRPFLQNPAEDGVTVTWFTHAPSHSWIEYGDDPALAHPQKAEQIVDGQVVCNTQHHQIRLTGLQPGKTYYYRAHSREILHYQAYAKTFGDPVASDVYHFTTPSADTDSFTAVIFNDLHRNRTTLDTLARLLDGLRYDFVVFNGDCIDDPQNENEAVNFLVAMADRTHAETHPFFFLRGNHEIRGAYSLRLRELIDYPDGKTYGAFSWGNTRFVLLDCGEDKPDSTWVYFNLNHFESLRREQTDFLRRELASPVFANATRRVLIHHIPLYGSTDDYNPCLDYWGNLLAHAPFDLCLNAHTHQYAYYPRGSAAGNSYPVIIGGGPSPQTATLMILKKTGKALQLTVLDAEGGEKLKTKN